MSWYVVWIWNCIWVGAKGCVVPCKLLQNSVFIYETTFQYLELLCQIVGIAPVCNSAAFVPCNSEVQHLLCFFLPATPVFYFSEVTYI